MFIPSKVMLSAKLSSNNRRLAIFYCACIHSQRIHHLRTFEKPRCCAVTSSRTIWPIFVPWILSIFSMIGSRLLLANFKTIFAQSWTTNGNAWLYAAVISSTSDDLTCLIRLIHDATDRPLPKSLMFCHCVWALGWRWNPSVFPPYFLDGSELFCPRLILD